VYHIQRIYLLLLYYMTEITFKLIRKANPEINFELIDEVSNISLSRCGVETIDNLELFGHIKELSLDHNNISKIENLFFFEQLDFLDLSFNKITGASLVESLKEIPRSLSAINLSGNPCVKDDDALIKLQDLFPSLGIIIDELEEGQDAFEEAHGEGNEEEEENEEEEPTEEYTDINSSSSTVRLKPLNADDVLKEIVERKSKLQSYMPFNLSATVTVRRCECCTFCHSGTLR
jgi:hypothetical protein